MVKLILATDNKHHF